VRRSRALAAASYRTNRLAAAHDVGGHVGGADTIACPIGLLGKTPTFHLASPPSIHLAFCSPLAGTSRSRYWVIRWYDAAGKRRSRHLGRADRLPRRHAENLRRQKEAELRSNPARRNISRAPTIASFLEFYFAVRATELAPGSLVLQRQTGRYLQVFFGADRRLDEIMRHDARAFKTALGTGDLMHTNKRQMRSDPVTVDLHIRNARTIFNRAVADDLLEYCPFDRLGSTPLVSRDWHYVSAEEFAKLMEAAPSPAWRLLLGLGRWAALRRGEALNLDSFVKTPSVLDAWPGICYVRIGVTL